LKPLLSLAAKAEHRQFLALLEPLLKRARASKGDGPPPLPDDHANGRLAHDAITTMTVEDENQFLRVIAGVAQTESGLLLLHCLPVAPPASMSVQEAFAIAVLLQAKKLVQRCQWDAADHLLMPVAASFTGTNPACRHLKPNVKAAVYNLLGCCQCMLQEF